MDFGAGAWDVSPDADQLSQSLFGHSRQGSKKAKKRKAKAPAVVKHESPKKLKADTEAHKKNGNNKLEASNSQASPTLTKSQKRRMKRKACLSRPRVSQPVSPTGKTEKKSTDTQQNGGSVSMDPNSSQKAALKGKKHSKGVKKLNVSSDQNLNAMQEKDPKEKNKNHKESGTDQGSVTDSAGENKPRKRRRGKKNNKAAPGVEKEGSDNDDVYRVDGVHTVDGVHKGAKKRKLSSSKSESVEGSPGKSPAPDVNQDKDGSPKKKKKRKRKCKKNKFKDYSKETEAAPESKVEPTGDSKVEDSGINGSAVSDNKSETVDAEKKKSAKKRRKRNKKQDKLKESAENEEETNVKMTSIKDKNKSKPNLKKAQAVSPDSKSASKNKHKTVLDPAKLGAILSDSKQDENRALDENVNKSSKPSKSLSLLEQSKERLKAARFRYINEQLYTSTGEEALEMFREDREAFNVYHAGFQGQVEKWPANPIDLIIEYVKARPKHLVVADFGCGDAKLGRSVGNKVHSFDLVALNNKVTVCDMSKVPLQEGSVDIAVFCLSLMGTNLTSYLQEANRVLKNGGTMKVAEVSSRFDSLGAFIVKVEKMGFKIKDQDSSNKMFVMMDFRKTSNLKGRPTHEIQLSPCVYKKR